MITKKNDFNNVPVVYCTTCLSLNIKTVKGVTEDVPYCCKCGNFDTKTAHIVDWEELYEDKYGKKFLDEDVE